MNQIHGVLLRANTYRVVVKTTVDLEEWALRIAVRWNAEMAELTTIKEGLRIVSRLGLSVKLLEFDVDNVVRDLNGDYPFSQLVEVYYEVKHLFFKMLVVVLIVLFHILQMV